MGFPGETEAEFEVLCDFVERARLDAIGVFGYSDEDGTEAESFEGKLHEDEISERVEHLTRIVDEVTAQRAEERIGEREAARRPFDEARAELLFERLMVWPRAALPIKDPKSMGRRKCVACRRAWESSCQES